jgi:shikimate kinase
MTTKCWSVYGLTRLLSMWACRKPSAKREILLTMQNSSFIPEVTADTVETIRAKLNGRPIVLVGLMGAGKSCIGRMVSKRLGIPFFDADKEIESAAGRSISDIFAEYGEPAFRDVEAKVIKRLLDGEQIVLATGGGAFMTDTTRDMINELSLSLWLRADLDLLVERTAGRTHRPLLNSGNPRDILAGLIEKRYPVYGEAHVIFDCSDESKEATCANVMRLLAANEASK